MRSVRSLILPMPVLPIKSRTMKRVIRRAAPTAAIGGDDRAIRHRGDRPHVAAFRMLARLVHEAVRRRRAGRGTLMTGTSAAAKLDRSWSYIGRGQYRRMMLRRNLDGTFTVVT
jgi:hypothetical protein